MFDPCHNLALVYLATSVLLLAVTVVPVTWMGSAEASMAPLGWAFIPEYVDLTLPWANAPPVLRLRRMEAAVSAPLESTTLGEPVSRMLSSAAVYFARSEVAVCVPSW